MTTLAPTREDAELREQSGFGEEQAAAPVDPSAPPSLDPLAIEEEIRARNLRLARESEVSDDLRFYLEQLAVRIAGLSEGSAMRLDPYLLLALQNALIGALLALDFSDSALARREMRTRLEQMRQVFRDIAEGTPLYEETSAKQLVAWLEQIVDVPQASLAELLGVSARTLQRWVSPSDGAAPDGDDARRIRIVTQVVNHLRHSLSGPGVVRWFQLPHPMLGGARPVELLDEPEAAARLTALAAATRSNTSG